MLCILFLHASVPSYYTDHNRNLGNILLIIVPAICTEAGSPFGDHSICKSMGLSYSSFSLALGSFYIWTYTFQLIKGSSLRYLKEVEESRLEPNKESDANEKTCLLTGESQEYIDVVVPLSYSTSDENKQNQLAIHQVLVTSDEKKEEQSSCKIGEILHKFMEELLSPPNIGSILGMIFGATPWLKKLVMEDDSPLRVIQDSIMLLGDGTLPCITLILGGNLIQGKEPIKMELVTIRVFL
ncbi:hypothetical protein LXL04_013912 [Taraxacum kok-saghyz]